MREPIIGIGITCHNRPSMTNVCLDAYKKFSPNAEIIIVDDGSTPPYPRATDRNKNSKGIAYAKNRCLMLLEHCDYIFLSDDDNYPKKFGWEQEYIEAHKKTGCHFFSLTWSREQAGKHGGHPIVKKHEHITEYSHACGVLIFMTNECLKKIGGFDLRFGKFGHEHIDLQRRAYNAGLAPFPFCDIPNSLDYFYPHDFYKNVKSTVANKKAHCRINAPLLEEKKDSKEFVPYKPHDNAVITNFLSGTPDPQSGLKYSFESHLISELVQSCQNQLLIVLSDCIELKSTNTLWYVQAKSEDNPYFQRWVNIRDYLIKSNHNFIFCVDATDVEMVNNPFYELQEGKIYVGDENQVVGCKWIIDNHKIDNEDYREFMRKHSKSILLNAGVIGGDRETMLNFLDKLIDLYHKTKEDYQMTDMALFNFVLYTYFSDKIEHGRKVTNVFKSYTKNEKSWWKHK